jgi:flagellar assembly protein FliH
MSCKIVPPGGAEDGPVMWRQVRGESPAGLEQKAAAAAAQAAERLAKLERELQTKTQEAYQAGLRDGEASGRKRADGEFQAAAARMAKSIEEIAGLRARLRKDAEADLVQLALAISKRILRREISLDPEALHGLILGALEKLQVQEISRVRVNPSHSAMLSACLREAGGGVVEVVPDPSREPGAIVFETQRGNLDASVDSQLREIERGLADRLRRNG